VLKKKEQLTPAEIRQKIFRYCAYQERSHLEVKNKLFELGAGRSESDEILTELITQGFLNEERFAKSFAGGKFRLKSWGRIKISLALESKGLTKNCIKSGLSEIDEESYQKTLLDLVDKKSEQIVEKNPYVKRDKVANYLIQKGFEPELVWKVVKEKLVN
jgi:regulatory protein